MGKASTIIFRYVNKWRLRCKRSSAATVLEKYVRMYLCKTRYRILVRERELNAIYIQNCAANTIITTFRRYINIKKKVKSENPDAIVKPPSSPVGLKLLLRKNAMQAERSQSSSSDAKENERKDGNEISSPFATKLLMRKHETQKGMEPISLDGNESDSLYQKSRTMLRNKEENPGAIVKSPSSPLGSKLLLRKNEMQAER